MNWTRGKLIGHGSSAAVSLARTLPSGDIFAVKSIEYSRSKALRKEQEIHSSIKSERIIEYKGYDVTFENGKLLYNIFLEYASGGTLVEAVQNKGSGPSDPLVRRYTKEILQGLDYLHSKGIVHCDIKGANILVTNEGVKIGDFGCCKRIDDVASIDCPVTEMCGTPMYMAPEVARGEQQSYPADVWALGCTVLEMATGLSPWPNITQDPLSALYHIGFSSALPGIPDFLSDQAQDFLSQCLKRDPKERWSVAELLKHPFVVDNGPVHGPSLETPTSILDQGMWEALDVLHSAQKKNEAQERSTIFPSEILRELMVDSSCDKFPNWALDEDWITVRSNNTSNEAENIPSGPSLSEAQNFRPNMISENILVELNFAFFSLELLNGCTDTLRSSSSSKNKNDEIIECELTCNCMDVINYRLSNHENFSFSISLPVTFLASCGLNSLESIP